MSTTLNDRERVAPDPSIPAAIAAAAVAVMCVVLQISLIAALFPAVPLAAAFAVASPLLPVVLVAAWGSARDPVETVPAAVAAAAALGAVSSERVGWFLLALLPTIVAAVTLRAGLGRAPGSRPGGELDGLRDGRVSLLTVAALGAVSAAVGSAAYVALLTLAAGDVALFPELLRSIAATTVWSAGLAAVLAPLLRPLRRERRGLFI